MGNSGPEFRITLKAQKRASIISVRVVVRTTRKRDRRVLPLTITRSDEIDTHAHAGCEVLCIQPVLEGPQKIPVVV